MNTPRTAAMRDNSAVLRWRSPDARDVLFGYVLLFTVAAVLSGLAHVGERAGAAEQVLLVAFLVWRVSRRGRIAYGFLVLQAAGSYLAAVLSLARSWQPLVAALIVINAAGLVLVASPPVLAHLRGEPALAGWANVTGRVLRPPGWVILGGPFIGILITLALLGNVGFVAVPGCTPPGTLTCTSLAEGYPLRWLTAFQNNPMIDKTALFRDAVQWAVAAWSLLYLAWTSSGPDRALRAFRAEPRG